MTRFAPLLSLAAALLVAVPALAGTATLRPSALVDGDVIRVGDLFDNAGAKSQVVIAGAPQPGQRVVVDADWLGKVAVAYGVDWQPLSRSERITIERRSILVGAQDIAEEVKHALALAGAPADAEVQLSSRKVQMHVAAGDDLAIEVSDLDYDRRSGRFAAIIEAGAGQTPTRLRVTGRVFSVSEVPVLARAMQKGEVIGENDIEWKPMREAQIQRGVLTELDQVIGQQLRHAARPGQPLRGADVQRPVLVAKNSLVTMRLNTGGLSLTAQGRAVEDGGEGDAIRVTNVQSKLTVTARVEAEGIVSVLPAGQILAN